MADHCYLLQLSNSDYANYSLHILIFLQILKKISEHEFSLSYTDHLLFFSSGLEHRLCNYITSRLSSKYEFDPFDSYIFEENLGDRHIFMALIGQ